MGDVAAYRAALAELLMDPGNVTWGTNSLDAALRLALAEFSRVVPRKRDAVVTLVADGREFDLTAAPFALSDVLWVQKVLWPYDSSDPYPRYLAPFEVRGKVLALRTAGEPRAGDEVRVFYAAMQAIEGLDGAASTTLLDSWAPLLHTGAAGFAAMAKAGATAREFNHPAGAAEDVRAWGESLLGQFRAQLAAVPPEAGWVAWGAQQLPALLDPRVP